MNSSSAWLKLAALSLGGIMIGYLFLGILGATNPAYAQNQYNNGYPHQWVQGMPTTMPGMNVQGGSMQMQTPSMNTQGNMQMQMPGMNMQGGMQMQMPGMNMQGNTPMPNSNMPQGGMPQGGSMPQSGGMMGMMNGMM